MKFDTMFFTVFDLPGAMLKVRVELFYIVECAGFFFQLIIKDRYFERLFFPPLNQMKHMNAVFSWMSEHMQTETTTVLSS